MKYLENLIRENITPRGDGNSLYFLASFRLAFLNKREYNSERRRKLILFSIIIYIMNKREYNSERRQKLISSIDGLSYPHITKIREKLHKGTEIKNIAFYEKLK